MEEKHRLFPETFLLLPLPVLSPLSPVPYLWGRRQNWFEIFYPSSRPEGKRRRINFHQGKEGWNGRGGQGKKRSFFSRGPTNPRLFSLFPCLSLWVCFPEFGFELDRGCRILGTTVVGSRFLFSTEYLFIILLIVMLLIFYNLSIYLSLLYMDLARYNYIDGFWYNQEYHIIPKRWERARKFPFYHYRYIFDFFPCIWLIYWIKQKTIFMTMQ